MKKLSNDMTDITGVVEKRDLVITRLFDAPVELVWRAWTDPEYVMLFNKAFGMFAL